MMAKWQASKNDMSPRKQYIPEVDEQLKDNGVAVSCPKCGEGIDLGNLCVTHIRVCGDCCGC